MDGTALNSSTGVHLASEGALYVPCDVRGFTGPLLFTECNLAVPHTTNCDARLPPDNENEEEDANVAQESSVIISPYAVDVARASSRELLHSLLRSRPLQQTPIQQWEPPTAPLAITWHDAPITPPSSHKRMRSADLSDGAAMALSYSTDAQALKRFRPDTCNGSWCETELKPKCESPALTASHMANRKRPREVETFQFVSEW